MKKYLSAENIKNGWWFIFNLLVTLFVVTLMGVRGANGLPGSNGSNGTDGSNGLNGLDGQDGAYIRQTLIQDFADKPVGDARAIYASNLVNNFGYIPLNSLADFETQFVDVFASFSNDVIARSVETRKYVLTGDIDFTNATPSQRIPNYFTINGNQYGFEFRGIFDGAGYTISNFSLSIEEQYVGFFPRVYDAVIKNITFVNANVNDGNAQYGTNGYVGVVIGYSGDDLDLFNIEVEDAVVWSSAETGGLVGYTDGTTRIVNSHVTDMVVGSTESAGGFIGRAGYGHVLIALSSTTDGYINGYDLSEWTDNEYFYTEVGGFIGEVDDLGWLMVYRSFNSARLASRYNEVGGFFGDVDNVNRLFISQSYNAGVVQAFEDYAGGFIGGLSVDFSVNIQDSFNIGTIYGDDDTGGLIGNFERDNRHPENYISNVYNAGIVLGGYDGSIGGLIGDVDNSYLLTIQNSFSVTEFSPMTAMNSSYEPSYFPTHGALIGDTEEVLFHNVYYYADDARLDYYMLNATDIQFDFGTAISYQLSDFMAGGFVLQNQWNFNTIWEFSEDSDFPILQDLPFIGANVPDTDYGIHVEGYGFIEQVEVESGISPVEVYFYFLEIFDADDRIQDITFELLIADYDFYNDDYNVENLLANGQVVYTTQGYPTYGEPITFTHEETTEQHIYLVVTDPQGNQDADYFTYFTPQLSDTIAPTLSNQAISADFIEFDPTAIQVNFTTATDNITATNDLSYYFLVSTTTEAYADVETAVAVYQNGLFAYAGQFVPNGTGAISESFTNIPGLQINTEYYVSIMVKDLAGNYSLYAYTPVQIVD